MKIHPFAMAAQGIGPDHPINHDVNVTRLMPPLSTALAAAIEAGDLRSYTALDNDIWVPRVQVGVIVGLRRKLDDTASAWFLPPAAVMAVPYLPEPITDEVAANSPYQRSALITARATADYLTALQAAMPPRPFDIHVDATSPSSAPLRRLIEEQALSVCVSESGWWISTVDVSKFLPEGASFDDPDCPWYVDPHDWADQDEVDRLIWEHRRNWPEIYGTADAGGVASADISANGVKPHATNI